MNDILPDSQKSPTSKAGNLWKIGAVGAVLVGGVLYGVLGAMPNALGRNDIDALKIGQMAKLDVLSDPPLQPVASFKGPDGAEVQLSAFKGKVILVNLWATWCAPCIMEMPTLANLQTEFKGKDFLVVAVSVDRDSDNEEARTQLATLSKGALQFFHDPKMAIVYPMRARGFPTSVLYDRQGKEVARLAGEADWDSPEAYAVIKAVVSRK